MGLFVAYLVASLLAFDRGYILDLFHPLSLLPVVYASNIVYVVITEQSDKRFVKEFFADIFRPR